MSTLLQAIALVAVLGALVAVLGFLGFLAAVLTARVPRWFTELGSNEIRFVVAGDDSPTPIKVLDNVPNMTYNPTTEMMEDLNGGPRKNHFWCFWGRALVSPFYPIHKALEYLFEWDGWQAGTDEKGLKRLRPRGYDTDGTVSTYFLRFENTFALNCNGIELSDGDADVTMQFQVVTQSRKPLIPIFKRDRKKWAIEFLDRLRGLITNAARKISGEQLKTLEMVVPITSVQDAQNFLENQRKDKSNPSANELAAEDFWLEIVRIISEPDGIFLSEYGQKVVDLQYLGYNNPNQVQLQLLKRIEREGQANVRKEELAAKAKEHQAAGEKKLLEAEVSALGVTGTIQVRTMGAFKGQTLVQNNNGGTPTGTNIQLD